MKGEFTIGHIRGIPIKIHWTLILFLPVLAFIISSQLENVASFQIPYFDLDPGPLLTPEGRIYAGIVVAIGLFVSVLLHELGHAVVAMAEGVEVRQITLWILGGLAMLKGITKDPKAEAKIALAGPAVSLALGAIPLGVFAVVDLGPFVTFPILYLGALNVILAVFNMMPAFPLDGGRVLRAVLGFRMSFAKATTVASNVGKGMAVLLGLVGLFVGDFLLLFVALFIYMAASQEAKGVELFDALERVSVREIMNTEVPAVRPDAHVDDLIAMMMQTQATGFPVVRDDTVLGVVTLEDIQSVPEAERSLTRIEDVMSRDVDTVSPAQPASNAMRKMMDEDLGRLLVVEGGRLAGVVTRQSLMQAFEILQILPQREPELAGPTGANESSDPFRW
jgi:Zn-dependent protease/CBS domain-containing protein